MQQQYTDKNQRIKLLNQLTTICIQHITNQLQLDNPRTDLATIKQTATLLQQIATEQGEYNKPQQQEQTQQPINLIIDGATNI